MVSGRQPRPKRAQEDKRFAPYFRSVTLEAGKRVLLAFLDELPSAFAAITCHLCRYEAHEPATAAELVKIIRRREDDLHEFDGRGKIGTVSRLLSLENKRP